LLCKWCYHFVTKQKKEREKKKRKKKKKKEREKEKAPLTKIGRSTRVEDGSKANRAFNNVPDFY
jgi:hypothetical protein